MDLLLSIGIGIGLSAACGFRVFVPLLGINIAVMSGHLELAQGFEWMGTNTAFAALLVATLLEIAAYYIPFVDNLLDTIATPAAFIAGTLATASVVGDTSALLQWALALIAGGGTAGTVQVGTVAVRGASSMATAGTGNAAVATAEDAGSVTLTVLAVVLAAFLVFMLVRRRFREPKVET